MKTAREITNLKGKRVLLRTDFDVPVDADGRITESFRIEKQKETINYLLNSGAQVVMVAHSNYVSSFQSIIGELEVLLNHNIKFIPELKDASEVNLEGSLGLLENIRVNEGEKTNDENLGKLLSSGFDYFVNNAFAECHRNYASVSAVTKFIPSYAGFLLEEETSQLTKVLSAPAEGKILITGGAKASTKLPVIKNFFGKVDKILVGGVIANDILKKEGADLHGSKFDNDLDVVLAGFDTKHLKLIMPTDYNIHDGKYLDIGPSSIENFGNIISSAKMIIWNGPLGFFEDERFAIGTNSIARKITSSDAFKVIGGGDTITAVNKLGLLNKFDFVSTGGGAMLSFLAGEKLPGLEALGYYE